MKEPKLTLLEHFCLQDELARKEAFCKLVSKLRYANDIQLNEDGIIYNAEPDGKTI